MEACNLGAYFAAYSHLQLQEAIDILSAAPHYADPGHAKCAKQVIDTFPEGAESLAIPTWFYGHEPSNLFASHIAKYFSNSIREDGLLAIAKHGIIFAPGSAGTTQEIFMDAVQNHYGTFQYYSPMVFLGHKRYKKETLLFPVLEQLAWGKEYHHMLSITDHPEEALAFIQTHPPEPVIKK
jgi:predicted Rossmann-fold nucleotide-binding protein